MAERDGERAPHACHSLAVRQAGRWDLELTPAGRDKLKAARPHWRRGQAAFEKHFGAEDAAAMRSLLQAVPGGRARARTAPRAASS